MSKSLVFMQEHSPIYEDYKKSYSRIRFYSDTIVKLAEAYCCDNIYVIYPESSSLVGRKAYTKQELEEVSSDISQFENCQYLKEESDKFNKSIKFTTIENFLSEDRGDFITIFGILNCMKDELYDLISKYYSKVIDKSLFYHYLSSDAELSSEQYILNGRTSFLVEFNKFEETCIQNKLKSVLITEVKDDNILSNYRNVGVNNVIYVPMIIDYDRRVDFYHTTNRYYKNDKSCLLLRNLEQWYKERPEVLKIFEGHLDIYESSMPAIRKKLLPIADEFSLNYKHARFWKLDQMVSLLSNYDYYIGASSPFSSRFTYKIIESSAAQTLCLSPRVSLKPINMEDSSCQEILNKYNDLFVLNDSSEISQLVNSCSNNFETYLDYLNRQYNFVKEYFDINSENINSCISRVVE